MSNRNDSALRVEHGRVGCSRSFPGTSRYSLPLWLSVFCRKIPKPSHAGPSILYVVDMVKTLCDISHSHTGLSPPPCPAPSDPLLSLSPKLSGAPRHAHCPWRDQIRVESDISIGNFADRCKVRTDVLVMGTCSVDPPAGNWDRIAKGYSPTNTKKKEEKEKKIPEGIRLARPSKKASRTRSELRSQSWKATGLFGSRQPARRPDWELSRTCPSAANQTRVARSGRWNL
jgi:hypothetical protein